MLFNMSVTQKAPWAFSGDPKGSTIKGLVSFFHNIWFFLGGMEGFLSFRKFATWKRNARVSLSFYLYCSLFKSSQTSTSWLILFHVILLLMTILCNWVRFDFERRFISQRASILTQVMFIWNFLVFFLKSLAGFFFIDVSFFQI